ncbi:MAG: nicotinamide-nucleotide amidohydrolase family protein [Nitrosomonas sp.]|nr:nicotinamide-nucleotide amidohydrolase family protein [Nitrosomonas sp.]
MLKANDKKLLALAQQTGELLKRNGLMLATAESCTGGWIGQTVTAVPGSSAWFDRGFIAYSNLAKQQMLSVTPEILTRFGAVSEQVAREMAHGALKPGRAQIATAVTGIAGPEGGTAAKPVGTVCFAWLIINEQNHSASSRTCLLDGDREAIRRQAVAIALQGLLALLEAIEPPCA